MSFPIHRGRRLRRTPALRALARETHLAADRLVAPLFVCPGSGVREPIASMPGQARLSPDLAAREAAALAELGVGSVLLFGIPAAKDAEGSGAWDPDGPVPQAIRRIKRDVPELAIWADVCLCEYTSHGHCGLLHGREVDNDATLPLLARASRVYAEAGADVIAPSDMDHFAVPEDELARALERRELHRNFMGYTVQAARDMVAIGVSGIGDVQSAFVQNTKKLNEYYDALDAGRFPIERGYGLDRDDEIRRQVITTLMCNAHLTVGEVERRFGITFAEYFAPELAELTGPQSAQADGLVRITPEAIEVTALGRLLVRNVCMKAAYSISARRTIRVATDAQPSRARRRPYTIPSTRPDRTTNTSAAVTTQKRW